MTTHGWMRTAAACAALLVVTGRTVHAGPESPTCSGGRLTYDQVEQRSIHNAYTLAEAWIDQLVYYRVRNVEIDLRGGIAGPDWQVFHNPLDPTQVGRGLFSDYLRLFRAFHDAVPQHEVVTVTLELKQDDAGSALPVFDPAFQRTPDTLDALMRGILGDANLYTPAMLMARCPQAATLQDAVALCGWPTAAERRGKFVVTIHEFNEVKRRFGVTDLLGLEGRMFQYVDFGRAATARVGFIAPLFRWVSDDLLRSVPYAVFATELKNDPALPDLTAQILFGFNLVESGNYGVSPLVIHGLPGFARAAQIRAGSGFRHMILRSADTGADAASFAAPELVSMNFMLTDKLNWQADFYARTHNAFLYPLCPAGVVGSDCWTATHAASDLREREHLLELDVRSGDIDGTADSFVFAHEAVPTPVSTRWTTLVSGASNTDDVAEHAKGCLMARRSITSTAPFFAVCRHGDDEQLQVHYRTCEGCAVVNAFANLPQAPYVGMKAEDAAFVMLRLDPLETGAVVARGYGSMGPNGPWQAIGGPVTFASWLPLQGIAASSYQPDYGPRDGQPPHFLFANPTKNGVRYFQGPIPPNTTSGFWGPVASFPYVRAVGTVQYARLQDHSYPLPTISVTNVRGTTLVGKSFSGLPSATMDGVDVAWDIVPLPTCTGIFSIRVGAVATLQSGKTVQYFQVVLPSARTFRLPLTAGSSLDPVRSVTAYVDASAADEENEIISGGAAGKVVVTTSGF